MRYRITVTLMALLLCVSVLCVPALAAGEEPDEIPPFDVVPPPIEAETSPDGAEDAGSGLIDIILPPDGTGSVIENITQNDREFFTIATEDGNVFYLIVDRQRAGENVYFLNTVTEQDLISLAEKKDGVAISGVPNPSPSPEASPEPSPTPSEEQEGDSAGGKGSTLFIALAVGAVGIAGFYFKIIKKKQEPSGTDDSEYDDEPDYDDDPEDEE